MKLFSFGGGVQSTACLVLAAREKIEYRTFIFADVGSESENPLTIRYVREVSAPYARKHGIEIVTVFKRNRKKQQVDLYRHLLASNRSIDIPVRMAKSGAPGRRNCTTEFKVRPISNWMKKHPEFRILGKGISTDEISRARVGSGFDYYDVEYPLIDLCIDREECMRIIKDAGLPVAPKSSCVFCPFKRPSEWQDLKEKQPDEFDRCCSLERILIARRMDLGKDAVYLSGKGAKTGAFLGETVSGQLSFDLSYDLESCESGFCFT